MQSDTSSEDDEDIELQWPTVQDFTNRDYHFYRSQNHEAYISCIKIILGAVLEFTKGQFSEHKNWLLPILASLILADNIQIRILLKKIFDKYVTPSVV